MNYHSVKAEVVLKDVQSKMEGLGTEAAAFRLKRDGPNSLPRARPKSFAIILLAQFKSSLIYILLIIGLLSLALREWTDAAFIFAVLIINALIGAIQEVAAQKSALSLRELAQGPATVRREGKTIKVPTERVVKGDIVLVQSGEKVPADLRLLETTGLMVDESLLTGEAFEIEKNALALSPPASVAADQRNMLFAGSIVAKGRAIGVSIRTGKSTELGKIADEIIKEDVTKSPLILRMEGFTRKLAIIFAVLAIVIGGTLILNGEPFAEVLLITVALGVGCIPEGLPVAITVALSVASKKMAKKNVIVKRLAAVEALGSCTYIGTDKTGTLTLNTLKVASLWLPSQRALDFRAPLDEKAFDFFFPLVRCAVLCNEAVLSEKDHEFQGDSVDVALLSMSQRVKFPWSEEQGKWKVKKELPYEPELKHAATLRGVGDNQQVFVKGALEVVLPMCAMDSEASLSITKKAADLAKEGLRVLAFASGDHVLPSLSRLNGLNFLGLIAMEDPLRPESKAAIIASKKAGIQVSMITGDHPVTALAVAKRLGLAEGIEDVTTGLDLKGASSEHDYDALVRSSSVFARVEPIQKNEIGQSLMRQGHFIAMTGDGANDALALKTAHVGVAMGKRGTDVAKESADLIISDDKYSSIIDGVLEGRIAYANVRKVIYLLISTGGAEIILFLLSIMSGLPMPLTAVQLLWLNLVTNGIQDVALAFEPGEGDELKKRPRGAKEKIFDKRMTQRVLLSAMVMGGVSFFYYQYLLSTGLEYGAAQNFTLLLMVLFENVMVGNARSETQSAFSRSPFDNPLLLFGTLGAQIVHLAAMHFPPLAKILGVAPIGLSNWLLCLGLALTCLMAMEIYKWVKRTSYS